MSYEETMNYEPLNVALSDLLDRVPSLSARIYDLVVAERTRATEEHKRVRRSSTLTCEHLRNSIRDAHEERDAARKATAEITISCDEARSSRDLARREREEVYKRLEALDEELKKAIEVVRTQEARIAELVSSADVTSRDTVSMTEGRDALKRRCDAMLQELAEYQEAHKSVQWELAESKAHAVKMERRLEGLDALCEEYAATNEFLAGRLARRCVGAKAYDEMQEDGRLRNKI